MDDVLCYSYKNEKKFWFKSVSSKITYFSINGGGGGGGGLINIFTQKGGLV